MMKPRLLAIAVLLSLSVATANAQHSYFRSDQGLAVNDKVHLPSQLDNNQNLIWRVELPPGHSTPCIQGDRIFVTSFIRRAKRFRTTAVSRIDGKILWHKDSPTVKKIERYHSTGSPAAPSPSCDGKRVVVFFGSYGMLCYGLDGKLLWKKPMGPFQDEFGASSSPILLDDRIYMVQDHDVGNFVAALDARNGKQIWKTPRDGFTRSYGSPMIWKSGNQRQLIVPGALQLTSYDLKSGKRIWWFNGLARIVNTTPIQYGDTLCVASWTPGGDPTERISMQPWPSAAKKYDKNTDKKITRKELPRGAVLSRFFRIDLNQDGGLDEQEWEKHAEVFRLAQNAVVALRPDGKGNITESHRVWKYQRAVPYVASPLHYRGLLFLVRDAGIMTTLDGQTGKRHKQGRLRGRGRYYASPVAGDGKVYFASCNGTVTVVSAEGKWKILSSTDLGEPINATPILDNGSIYIRTEKALYRYSDNQLSPKEKKLGWIRLFDGETLKGWKTSKLLASKRPVENGAINPHKCGAYMMIHEKDWHDYKLKLDFKVSKGCNSGVFFRTFPILPKRDRDVGYNGMEIAIDDNQKTGYHATGAIYDLVPAKKSVSRRTGEWNHMVLTCQDNLITVVVNGTTVSTMDANKFSKKGIRADGTKHKFTEIAYKNHPRHGYIGLQDHGANVWFKNIKILPLK